MIPTFPESSSSAINQDANVLRLLREVMAHRQAASSYHARRSAQDLLFLSSPSLYSIPQPSTSSSMHPAYRLKAPSMFHPSGIAPPLPAAAPILQGSDSNNNANIRIINTGSQLALSSLLRTTSQEQTSSDRTPAIPTMPSPQQNGDLKRNDDDTEKTLKTLGGTLRGEDYMDASQMQVHSLKKATKKQERQGKKAPKHFTKILHEILRDERYSHIISFLPHGRAFCVHDTRALAQTVMPAYFKKSKSWETFARQLSLYGFRRLNAGPDVGCYYHELFLQGRPELAEYMDRVGIPSGGRDRRRERSQHAKRADPNFYMMAPCTVAGP